MPSKRYVEIISQCSEMHRKRKIFSGRGVLKHRKHLLELSAAIGAKSALDYGCGKALQFLEPVNVAGQTLEQALGYDVKKYDPCVPQFERLPTGKFDLVWCTDVLECVPEEDMDDVLAEVFCFARKAVFLTVASYPAKKSLPNGENSHVTIKPAEWWRAKVDKSAHQYLAATGYEPRVDLFVG